MSVLSDWLSTQEAAKMAGYHPDHIRRLIRKGDIQARKWGNAWMVNKESLLAYLVRIGTQGERRGPKTNQEKIL